MSKEKNIFIIGSKGIPAKYGGFETFVDKLTEKKVNKDIKYHVACMNSENEEFEYNNSRCFSVRVPNIGPAKAILYDLKALKDIIKYIKNNKIQYGIVYVLACRIGPFISYYKRKLSKLGIKLYVNPDGHEWKRAKWNTLIKKYWKISEKLMVKHADLLICDSINIEKYIKDDYKKYNPKTTFIPYGADTENSSLLDNDRNLIDWYNKKKVRPYEYYLIVGRFVPENNYKTVIKEFMKTSTKKDLVIITNVEKNKFYTELQQELDFKQDSRIKFVGTVYDKELIKKIRENAYAYIHGHEVGGTNPSLLEALASTKLNLLLDISFNREVGQDSALYWNKENNNLKNLIESCELFDSNKMEKYNKDSTNRVNEEYNWNKIINKYEIIFMEKNNG